MLSIGTSKRQPNTHCEPVNIPSKPNSDDTQSIPQYYRQCHGYSKSSPPANPADAKPYAPPFKDHTPDIGIGKTGKLDYRWNPQETEDRDNVEEPPSDDREIEQIGVEANKPVLGDVTLGELKMGLRGIPGVES